MTSAKELAASLRSAIHIESANIAPQTSNLIESAKQAAEYLEGQADLPVGVDGLVSELRRAAILSIWDKEMGLTCVALEIEPLLTQAAGLLAWIDSRPESRAASFRGLQAALNKIAALNPETDSSEGCNEWGEADCFNKAQDIARGALGLSTADAVAAPNLSDNELASTPGGLR
jgi:hypothetical protein